MEHWAWKAGTGWKVGARQRSLARDIEGDHMVAKQVWNTGPGRPVLGGRWAQGKEVWRGALKVATWWRRRYGTLGLEGRHWVEGGRKAKKFGQRHRRWPHGGGVDMEHWAWKAGTGCMEGGRRARKLGQGH